MDFDGSGRHLIYLTDDGRLFRWSGGDPMLLYEGGDEGFFSAAW